jgi:ABC-type Fe3+/spermidine/putrescine transport system ATPase subunit
MQTEIRRIHRTLNVTIVYVTHDQDEALTMSDRIAIMNLGRIEQLGKPAELYETPRTRFVADFLGEQNFIEGVVVALNGAEARLRTDDGLELGGEPAAPLAAGARVVAAVRPEKIAIGAAQAEGGNQWTGTIRDAVYSGEVTRYSASAGGLELKVKAQNRLVTRKHAAGETVSLSWTARETRIFPL